MHDYVKAALSSNDFIDSPSAAPYSVGTSILLHCPERRQKRLSPYEDGWVVKEVVPPSTVVLPRHDNAARTKLVNIALIKECPVPATVPDPPPVPGEVDAAKRAVDLTLQ
eukprot:scpid102627/ scgid27894/ 